MKNKKNYIAPSVELLILSTQDVITASIGVDAGELDGEELGF